jgi:hypothetical protein
MLAFIILGVVMCTQNMCNQLSLCTQYQIHLFIILGVALCTQFIRNMLTINVRNIKSTYLPFKELHYVPNLSFIVVCQQCGYAFIISGISVRS